MESLKERLLLVRECLCNAKNLNQWLSAVTIEVADAELLRQKMSELARVRDELDVVQTTAFNALKKTEDAVKRNEVELKFNGINNAAQETPKDKQQVLEIISVLTKELKDYLTVAKDKSVHLNQAMREALSLVEALSQGISESLDLMIKFDFVRRSWLPICKLPVDALHEHIGLMEKTRDQLVEPISLKIGSIKHQAKNVATFNMAMPEAVHLRLDNCLKRWKLLQVFWNERSTELADRTRGLAFVPEFVLASAVQAPWKRAVLANSVPYYMNHKEMTTSWDHPGLTELLKSMIDLDDNRFSAYRTALKLRRLQTALYLDLVSLDSLKSVLTQNGIIDFSPTNSLTVTQITKCLLALYSELERKHGEMIKVPLCTDLCLNWLLNLYDSKRTGFVNSLCFVTAISSLCKSKTVDIYRFLFCRIADSSLASIDSAQLSLLVGALMRLPLQISESRAFGGSDTHTSVDSCFQTFGNKPRLQATEFMDWMRLEPQSLVWLPVMHRLAEAENLTHASRCVVCRDAPIVGLLYRCLRRFNHDICQNCFYSTRVARQYRFVYPIVEYCTAASSSENIRDLAKIVRNKLRGSGRSSKKKVGYLPLSQQAQEEKIAKQRSKNEAVASSRPPVLTRTMTASPPATGRPSLNSTFPDVHISIRACAIRLAALEHLKENGNLAIYRSNSPNYRNHQQQQHQKENSTTTVTHKAVNNSIYRHSAVFDSSHETGDVMHTTSVETTATTTTTSLRLPPSPHRRLPAPVFEQYDNLNELDDVSTTATYNHHQEGGGKEDGNGEDVVRLTVPQNTNFLLNNNKEVESSSVSSSSSYDVTRTNCLAARHHEYEEDSSSALNRDNSATSTIATSCHRNASDFPTASFYINQLINGERYNYGHRHHHHDIHHHHHVGGLKSSISNQSPYLHS